MTAGRGNAVAPRVPALCALALWIGLFSMACRWAEAPPGKGDSAAGRALGGLRRLAARRFYYEADRYHHRGIGHERQTAIETPLHRLGRQLTPSAHVHVEGVEASEILPWLRWTVTADPEDVEAWRVAAYWVGRSTHRPDLVRAVYREAARHHPRDYRIHLDWARQLLHEGAWSGAARLCDRALALWPSPLDPQDQEAALDFARLLEWRAYLYAYEGDRARALGLLERVIALRPAHRLAADEAARLRSDKEIAGRLGPGLSHLRETLDHPADLCEDGRH